jgi:hypothetical protein
MHLPKSFTFYILFLVLSSVITFHASAQVAGKLQEHEVIDMANGMKLEVLRFRGEGEKEEADVIYYTDKRQTGTRKWEPTSKILQLKQASQLLKDATKVATTKPKAPTASTTSNVTSKQSLPLKKVFVSKDSIAKKVSPRKDTTAKKLASINKQPSKAASPFANPTTTAAINKTKSGPSTHINEVATDSYTLKSVQKQSKSSAPFIKQADSSKPVTLKSNDKLANGKGYTTVNKQVPLNNTSASVTSTRTVTAKSNSTPADTNPYTKPSSDKAPLKNPTTKTASNKQVPLNNTSASVTTAKTITAKSNSTLADTNPYTKPSSDKAPSKNPAIKTASNKQVPLNNTSTSVTTAKTITAKTITAKSSSTLPAANPYTKSSTDKAPSKNPVTTTTLNKQVPVSNTGSGVASKTIVPKNSGATVSANTYAKASPETLSKAPVNTITSSPKQTVAEKRIQSLRPVNSTAHINPVLQDTGPIVRIAVFAPIYLDDAFTGTTYNLGKSVLPKNILPGLEFYNGVMMAVDSMSKEGANVEVTIFDTKQVAQSLAQILTSPQLNNTGLIIAAITNTFELKQFSQFALSKNIPLISATFPNTVGVTGNPFFVLLNSSFTTHIEGLYKHMQKYYNTNTIIAVKQAGTKDDYIKNYITALNKNTRSVPLSIKWVDLKPGFTSFDLMRNLDSTRNNVVFVASPLESFGLDVVRTLSLNESYRCTAIGMPTWDGIKELNGKDCQNVEVVYSTPFLFNSNNHELSNEVVKTYREKYYSRPSDMVYKGYETTYHFGKLLTKYRANLINNLSDKQYTLFNQCDIQPIKLKSGNPKPDYLENRKLYFIKKQQGIVKNIL